MQLFKIPPANVNKVWYGDNIAHVILQPGDATNYEFSFKTFQDLAIIEIRQPHRKFTSISHIERVKPSYDDKTIAGLGQLLGNLHSAAIIALATKMLLRKPGNIALAAKYAMSVRYNQYYH